MSPAKTSPLCYFGSMVSRLTLKLFSHSIFKYVNWSLRLGDFQSVRTWLTVTLIGWTSVCFVGKSIKNQGGFVEDAVSSWTCFRYLFCLLVFDGIEYNDFFLGLQCSLVMLVVGYLSRHWSQSTRWCSTTPNSMSLSSFLRAGCSYSQLVDRRRSTLDLWLDGNRALLDHDKCGKLSWTFFGRGISFYTSNVFGN